MTTRYRTNADGSAVCRHRDLSVCDECAAADERLVDVAGAYFLVADPAERAALIKAIGDGEGSLDDIDLEV